MNLTLLRAFHRVADAGGVTAAARAGAASQPTLSAQIRALEAGSGASLFNRRGRRITLTPLGQSLHAISTRLFAAEEEARALLTGAERATSGLLRLAADSPAHVMDALAALRRRHPAVSFSLRAGNSAEVIRMILDFEADLGVTARRTSDPRLLCRKLRHDRLVLFVPRRDPWVRRRAVRLADLALRDIVIRERGSVTREVFETRLGEAGVRPRRLVEVETREAVREAVLAGFGVGVVFASEMGADRATHALDVTGADLAVTEYVVCLEERSRQPLLRLFLEMVGEGAAPARYASAGRAAAM